MALYACSLVLTPSVSAQTLNTVVNFTGTNGASPAATLVQDSDGSFYGTTKAGGTSANCNSGCGTVFRVMPDGTLTTLVDFTGSNGYGPVAGLVQGSDGNFYGTTVYGGDDGLGTVFRVTPDGTLTTLVSFTGAGGDPLGSYPAAPLVRGSDGNFYGTTQAGGSSTNCSSGCGTVFRMTPDGAFTSLYSFKGGDGGQPVAGLVQGNDGNFYGTTSRGGSYGYGTVYRVSTLGTAFTTLVNFNLKNGSNSNAGLVQGSDGNFYGTTVGGGSSPNCLTGCGTVFRMTPDGTLTTLISFDGINGSNPSTALVQARDGNFYGTTSEAGSSDLGTVFRVTSSGSLATLINFNGALGATPDAGLVQATDGILYGTTSKGGTKAGTVFQLLITKGDFTGDGKSDILWRYQGTGSKQGYNQVWQMNGTSYVTSISLNTVSDLNWQIGGTEDFTGDGKTDIVWRYQGTGSKQGLNQVWQMNDTSYVSAISLPTLSDLNWQIGGTGDFTGDGKPDILWRNYVTGQNMVWQMNGTSYVTSISLNSVTDLNWRIVGTGDFTGDGKSDILWRYQGTGSKQGFNQVWQMNGTSYVTSISLKTETDLSWQIGGTGDYTGDGKPDILWRYNGGGAKQGFDQIWQMNGTSYASSVSLNTVSDLNWKIRGPR
ncbi:choice-of-anchor tandem repeat GloVer-containing protein [Gloeobacter kilaueensis]|uniref:FG-GAP repeat-containing protein n=1 Tax=Gloeobacter kilaueensis (strain ATCC BAA-2537 / CCAP 1431/1 / ULC 316 / JS1) TaxID=1183438 RepID=U5QNQ8_GLOK1|nr:choice-of-anchor tandem repeat GloVer-containing protein [Gloeobacter kilaueensis]AGY60627.1 hypothetical protein GKIL_4381 [Gloeobacter kilaueensis JS1]